MIQCLPAEQPVEIIESNQRDSIYEVGLPKHASTRQVCQSVSSRGRNLIE